MAYALNTAKDDEEGEYASEDLYIGWLSPEGEYHEAYSEFGDMTGNHDRVARELWADVIGVEWIDHEEVLLEDRFDLAQAHLLGRGWIRIDYGDIEGPDFPTRAQVLYLLEQLQYSGSMYVSIIKLVEYLSDCKGIREVVKHE
jgi:hypothetical protein